MKKIVILCLFSVSATVSMAQSVGIGTATPNASALLDISSTSKGLLMPRMTTAQRNLIVSPANGLQILNLDDHCLDMYDGTVWIKNCGFRITGTDTAEISIKPVANFGGTARSRAAAFSIGSKGYIGTGYDGAEKKDFWEYDPATNLWTQKADVGGSTRMNAVGFSISGLGYIGTGYGGGQYLSDFWQYNPATNTWTQKANVPGLGRELAVGFSTSTNGYIGLGVRNNFYLNDMEEYYPASNTWSTKTAFPFSGAYSMISFSINGFGYVGIGIYYHSILGSYLDNAFYKFNPAGSGTWTALTAFPGAERHDAVGFAIGNEGYVGTGYDDFSTRFNDLWHYNITSNSWDQLPNIGSTGRRNAVSFVIGSKAYVGTGFTGANSAEIISFEHYPIGPVYDNMLDYAGTGGIFDGIWTKKLRVVSTNYHVDIASEPRTQTHPTNLPFYVTGDIGSNYGGAEFRTSDGTKGIGLGSNTIYAAGSDANQNLSFSAKGPTGDLIFNTNGIERARITEDGNLAIGQVWASAPIQLKNALANRKIVLYDINDTDHQFFGFGANTDILRYQVEATSDDHVFYAGVNETTSNELFRIKGNGKVGIGISSPLNKLDINSGAVRTGTHPTGLALYVSASSLAASNGVEFRHDNGTQGIGFGFNTMYAAGSNASQDLGMSAKGASGNLVFSTNGTERMRIAGAGNVGIATPGPDQSFSVANKFGVDVNGAIHIKSTPRAMYFLEDGATNRMLLSHSPAYPAWGLQYIGPSNEFRFLADSVQVMSVNLGANQVQMNKLGIGTTSPHAPIMIAGAVSNRKIVLWETADNNHQFYGFGVNGNILRYQTDNTLSDHVFYAATSTTTSNELMRIKGNGNVTVAGIVESEAFIAATLVNGFTNYNNGYATAAYYKDKLGIVHLRGLVQNAGNPTNLTIFTLPAGYRPSTSGKLLFITINNNIAGRIEVLPTGEVTVTAGSAGWVGLDNISFRAD